MTRRALALALVCLALPRLALAEPARVRVFEAAARAEPSREAQVLQLLPENAEVSVSEDAKDGWRRVRLADGRVGWIEESALAFPAKAPAAAPTTAAVPTPPPPPLGVPPPPPGAPDLHARIYVKDLDHLATLVKEDPKVSPMADRLSERRRTAIGVGVAGGIASAIALGAGFAKISNESHDPADPNFMKDTGGEKLVTGGLVGALATGLVAAVIYPKGGDVLDVINAWNTSHPDRPFEIQGHGVGHSH